MGFLGDLGSAISSQFNLAQNTTNTLSSVVDGQQQQYGSLGSFASQFDQSAERRYLEEGYLRLDPFQTDPKQFNILLQEPSATVLVKKKMFSSIASNYRPDFMDQDEKLYYKAMCILFQNKCNQIAALEKLGKIQKVTAAVGNISSQLVPAIITLADTINNGTANGNSAVNAFSLFGGSNPFSTPDTTSFFSSVDKLRTLYTYNQTAKYTTWLTDPTNLFQTTLGPGSGIIEITNFTSINTSTSIDLGSPGSFSLTISDPYEMMVITDYDIEVALSDSTNSFYNNKNFQLGIKSANQIITDQQNNLNTIRNARNASPLTFTVDPNSIFGQKITVFIDRLGLQIPFVYDTGFLGLGSSVSVPADYLRGGNIAGYDGIDSGTAPIGPDNNIRSLVGNSELSAFQTIITATFAQLQSLQSSQTSFVSNNQSINYARRKLRFNFSSDLVIQPMDVVHIYMNSKTQTDNKILAGLSNMFSGAGILQNINNNIDVLSGTVGNLFNSAANVAVQAEKSLYVGPDFPNYLWANIRSQFVTEIEGTHVFAGLVKGASDNWTDGRFSINVDGDDNTHYFDQGKVNFQPGVENFNGLVYDSLTPFKSNFDSISNAGNPDELELLDENKYLISETGPGSLVKFKLGSLAGEKVTQGNYIQDQTFDNATKRLTRTLYAPDGLVYKWKQGIGIFTQSASSASINGPNLVGNTNIYQNPFAGLDVMNIVSLLITGIPYNYTTYFKATGNINGFQGDPQSGQSSSQSYLDSLRSDLSKNNILWGNFIPFKSLVLNQSALSQAMQAQSTVTSSNADLDAKLKQFANLQGSFTALGAFNVLAKSLTTNGAVNAQLTNLQSQASNLQNSINSSINDIQVATRQLFNQIKGPQSTGSLNNTTAAATDAEAHKIIMQTVNTMTRRMSYDVRANQDKNLFIVDDYYDNDYDIAAFNKVLSENGGAQLYSNEYVNIRGQLKNVSDLLNLEVFCDSQGHIRARPPQYNKMPSSIFYKMLHLTQTVGVQAFPQFFNQLFTDQLGTLKKQIEVIEDQIRLSCALLGQYPGSSLTQASDNAASSYIANSNISSGMSGTFGFISDYTDTIVDITTLIQQATSETLSDTVGKGLSDYDQIVNAGTSTKTVFSNAARYYILFQSLQAQLQAQLGSNTNNSPTTSIFQNSLVQSLITRINVKSGQNISSSDYLAQANPNQPLEIDTGQTIDLFKITDDLTNYISKWQQLVKNFYHTIKNAAEITTLSDSKNISNILSTPGIFENQYIPEAYAHMIEDENYDDYGVGSGSRYIIHNSQIKSLLVQKNPPDYTMVEVHGTISENFDEANGGGGPPNYNIFGERGGNGMVTAIAIDYDMWRNYGFKQTNPIAVPFFHDPDTQCGPYAAMVLTRNRANLLKATCSVIGNEYYQPGEVVYLETRNLLFYIKSVKHAYTEGHSFTTNLELIYGHSIGDYIPTYLDTIGKIIIKNGDSSNLTSNTIIQRQESSANEQSMGVIQMNGPTNTLSLATGTENTSSNNSYSTSNQTVINNILYSTAHMINSNYTPNNNVVASIELRIYYDNTSHNESTSLSAAADSVLNALTGASQGPLVISTSPTVQNPSLPTNSVHVIPVNMDDNSDRRSPSQKALDAARNQMANVSSNTANGTTGVLSDPNNNALRKSLFSYIIDCWLVLTPVSGSIPGNTGFQSSGSGT